MIKIKAIEIPTKGEAVGIEITVLPFNVPTETSIGTYYSLFDELDNKLLDGNVTVPYEVVSEWGTDDSVIINYVLTTLGLEEAPEEVLVEEPSVVEETEQVEEPIVVEETSEPQTT